MGGEGFALRWERKLGSSPQSPLLPREQIGGDLARGPFLARVYVLNWGLSLGLLACRLDIVLVRAYRTMCSMCVYTCGAHTYSRMHTC